MIQIHEPEELLKDPEWPSLSREEKLRAVDNWTAYTRINAERAFPDRFNPDKFAARADEFRARVEQETATPVADASKKVSGWLGEGILSMVAMVPAAARRADELLEYGSAAIEKGAASIVGNDELAAQADERMSRAAPTIRTMGENLNSMDDASIAWGRSLFGTKHYEQSEALRKQMADTLVKTDWKNPEAVKAALEQADALRVKADEALYEGVEQPDAYRDADRAELGKRVQDNAGLAQQYALTRNPKYLKDLLEVTGGSDSQRQAALAQEYIQAEQGVKGWDYIDYTTAVVGSVGGLFPDAGEAMVNRSRGQAKDPSDAIGTLVTAGAIGNITKAAGAYAAAGTARASASSLISEISQRSVMAAKAAAARSIAKNVGLGMASESVSGALGVFVDKNAPTTADVLEGMAAEAVGMGGMAGVSIAAGAVKQKIKPGKILWALDENGNPSPIPDATDEDLVALRASGATVVAANRMKEDGTPTTAEDIAAATQAPVPAGEAATVLDEIIADAGRTDRMRQEAQKGAGDIEESAEVLPPEAPEVVTTPEEISTEPISDESVAEDKNEDIPVSEEAVTEEETGPPEPIPFEQLTPGLHGSVAGVRGTVKQNGARLELHSNDGTQVVELNPDTPLIPESMTVEDLRARVESGEDATVEQAVAVFERSAAERAAPEQSAREQGRNEVITDAVLQLDPNGVLQDETGVTYEPANPKLERTMDGADGFRVRVRRQADGREVILKGRAAASAAQALFSQPRTNDNTITPEERAEDARSEGEGRRRRAAEARQRAAAKAKPSSMEATTPEGSPQAPAVTVDSIRAELTASNRNPDAIPAPELEAMAKARGGDLEALKALPPLRQRAVRNLVMDARDRRAGQALGIPPEEFDRLDASYSLPMGMSRQDAAYMAAVESGNVAEQQRLVDEAAKAAGYRYKAFHGSPGKPFWEFLDIKLGKRTGANSAKMGHFASSDPAVADTYIGSDTELLVEQARQFEARSISRVGSRASDLHILLDWRAVFNQETGGYSAEVIGYLEDDTRFRKKFDGVYKNEEAAEDAARIGRAGVIAEMTGDPLKSAAALRDEATLHGLYLKMDNPREVDFGGNSYRAGNFSATIREAKSAGNDGVIIRNIDDSRIGSKVSDVFVFFSSKQAKSADPMVRDAVGNVIPISQRFNPESNDIRYSRGPVRPQTTVGAQAIASRARSMGLSVRDARFRPRGRVSVLNRPDSAWEGRLLADGTIEINAAWMGTDADVTRVLRHELAHLAERDPANREAIDAVLATYTRAEKADLIRRLRNAGYSNGAIPSEVMANVTEQMASDFADRPAWQRLVYRITEWLKNLLGRPVGRAEAEVMAARLIANAVRQTQVTGPEALSDAVMSKLTALDAEYAVAVESGNVAEQQRLVDEAAKAAGYDVGPLWHRGPKWTVADFDLMDKRGQQLGLHLGTESQIQNISRRDGATEDKQVFSSIQNPLRLSDLGVWTFEALYPQLRRAGVDFSSAETKEAKEREAKGSQEDSAWVAKKLRAKIEESGHDSVVYLNMTEGVDHPAMNNDYRLPRSGRTRSHYTEDLGRDYGATDSFIVFKPEQIKSAEPVTRDASGNVIPLSRRFNPESNDIRYSNRGPATAQPVTSKVLTPEGWRLMGDMKPGDKVLTPSGRAVKVMAVRDYGLREVWDIRVAGGTSAQASLDHLWLARLTEKQTRVIDSRELAKRLRMGLRTDIQVVGTE